MPVRQSITIDRKDIGFRPTTSNMKELAIKLIVNTLRGADMAKVC